MNVHEVDRKIPRRAIRRKGMRHDNDRSSTFWMNFEFTTTAAPRVGQEGVPCMIG